MYLRNLAAAAASAAVAAAVCVCVLIVSFATLVENKCADPDSWCDWYSSAYGQPSYSGYTQTFTE